MDGAKATCVPRCPRCGYDQSGACGAWTDSCPLKGTCPECGLRFEWADVFFPQRKRLAWLFEHKHARSAGVVRAWRTWLVAAVPPRYWRRVTLAHESRWVVMLWPLVLLASCVFFGGAVRMVYALATGRVVLVWGFATGSPIMTWVPAEGLDRWGRLAAWAWGTPWYPQGEYWRSAGDLAQLLLSLLAAPAAIVASALITGATIMTLTTSRRICGVRCSHVRRAMVYRLAPLVIAYALWGIGAAGIIFRMRWYAAPGEFFCLATLGLGSAAWGAWWWACTLRTGWQMPEARLVAALLCTVDVLASLVVFVGMSPHLSGQTLL